MQRMGHWGSFMDPFCHRPCLRMQLVHIYSVHARLRGQKTVVIQELYLLWAVWCIRYHVYPFDGIYRIFLLPKQTVDRNNGGIEKCFFIFLNKLLKLGVGILNFKHHQLIAEPPWWSTGPYHSSGLTIFECERRHAQMICNDSDDHHIASGFSDTALLLQWPKKVWVWLVSAVLLVFFLLFVFACHWLARSQPQHGFSGRVPLKTMQYSD